MAGKIDKDGKLKTHRVRNRLKASRGKNMNKIDVQTNEFIYHLLTVPENLKMKKFNHVIKPIKAINIHVIYCKKDISASYLESILLFEFFKKNKVLPLLNLTF